MTKKDENLEEGKFKSDHSDSEIEGPIDTDAKSPEDDSKNDEKSKLKGKKTKAEMTSEVLDLINSKTNEELEALMPGITEAILNEESDDEDEDYDDDDDDDDVKESKKKMKESYKISASDLDISEEVGIIFRDDSLTEDFKSNAKTLFEASVVAKVNEVVDALAEDAARDLAETKAAQLDEIVDRIDDYLNHVVENWVEKNELAIDSGIRSEITESFIEKMRDVFQEHYIDVPEDRVDLVDELSNRVEDLENMVNEQVESNISLMKENVVLKKNAILEEYCDELVDTEADKLKSLAEGVEYTDEDDFRNKLESIVETYFDKSNTKGANAQSLTEDYSGVPVEDGEAGDEVPAHMRPYYDAIRRTTRT